MGDTFNNHNSTSSTRYLRQHHHNQHTENRLRSCKIKFKCLANNFTIYFYNLKPCENLVILVAMELGCNGAANMCYCKLTRQCGVNTAEPYRVTPHRTLHMVETSECFWCDSGERRPRYHLVVRVQGLGSPLLRGCGGRSGRRRNMFGDERATEAALALLRATKGAQDVLFLCSFLCLIFLAV